MGTTIKHHRRTEIQMAIRRSPMVILIFLVFFSGAQIATADEPVPAPWPHQFHALLFMNYSGNLSMIDLWYDWPNGRNFNIIQEQLGGITYDLEWNNGTSFFYTLDNYKSCRSAQLEVGILRPNWLDGANYLGQQLVNGFHCNVWEKVDFIWYYEDVETKRPVQWIFYTGREAHVMTFEVGAVLEDEKWQSPVYCFNKEKKSLSTEGSLREFSELRNSNLTLVVLICFVLIASRLRSVSSSVYNPHNTLKKQFGKWLQYHGKSYGGKDEWMFRFGIFQSNLQFIDYINSLHLPFKLAENRFADMTNSEFKAHFLGLNTSSSRLHSNHSCDPSASGNVPDAVDWRKEGAVTPIRDQGRCGGCWAFATVAAIEGITKIKTGNLIPLSEQQLIDCDTGSYNKGCSGGLMETAYEYLIANGGLVALDDYPYTATDGTGCDQEKSQNKIVTITGYEKVAPNEASLEVAAAQQPVSVGIDADGFIFQFYSSGVFTGYCGSSLNHAVTVVGYGEEAGEKYWIVKNTWGTGWGEEGYIRMERGYRKETGKCGITMLASYPLQ